MHLPALVSLREFYKAYGSCLGVDYSFPDWSSPWSQISLEPHDEVRRFVDAMTAMQLASGGRGVCFLRVLLLVVLSPTMILEEGGAMVVPFLMEGSNTSW